jgi:hypothetical protein
LRADKKSLAIPLPHPARRSLLPGKAAINSK